MSPSIISTCTLLLFISLCMYISNIDYITKQDYIIPTKQKLIRLKNIENISVLVTGGAGFIGHHVMKQLQKRNIAVIGIDNYNDYYPVHLKKTRAKITGAVYDVDVCNSDLVRQIMNKHIVTHVIHLAAQAGVRYSIEHPQAYVKSNIECFVELLELLKAKNISLVYASSSSVYGKNIKIPFLESDPVVQPVSLYAATKLENELMAHVYWNMYKLRSIGLRFFTVYGPLGRPDMAYYSFTKNITTGSPISVFNHGNLYRDFTYISDIVDGIIRCLQIDYEYEILNLGRGEPHKLMTFIKYIEDAIGKKAVLDYQNMANGDVMTTYADVSKAKRLLGYVPKISLKDGIEIFCKWYKRYNL